ncbi:MAG: translocation/assembly module TamB domain-containing protein, partial [Cyclobacteriaceae bacterium]
SNLKGELDGEYAIEGTLKQPLITGTGNLSGGQLTVNYLNTSYDFDAELSFKEKTMLIRKMVIYDEDRNVSNLSGLLQHDKLQDFRLDVRGTLNNFKVLNKSAKDGDSFYGAAKVTGDIRFFGPIENLTISANAITNRGTRFFIPLSETASVEQQDFIQIIKSKDQIKAKIEEEVKEVNLKGLNLDFDLEVTPDAYCEIIFDLTAGDIIRGRGDGKLKMQINTQGEFNMFGQVDIQEGAYNFTLYNVINKEFDILPNSTLTWSGDPFKAEMNIKASYNQLASLVPLFEDTTFHNLTEIRRKYPAKVLLELQGDLMSPEIDFDIEVENYPNTILVNRGGGAEAYSLAARLDAFNNRITNDEQELKRQVFSLMVLRRFSPENSFNVSGSFGNSVSEFISNQLSYWITQFDENLEIDVDLGSMDDEAFNTFQLRLSYTLMDGRLRITRNGGFTNQQNQPNLTSIAGDWTLEYFLSADGKLRVKMYNRTNFNNFDPGNDANTTTTAGFSLLHTESFDKVVELFQNSRKKNRKPENEKPSNSDAKKEDEIEPFTRQ